MAGCTPVLDNHLLKRLRLQGVRATVRQESEKPKKKKKVCGRFSRKYSDLPGAINWRRQWVRALEAAVGSGGCQVLNGPRDIQTVGACYNY